MEEIEDPSGLLVLALWFEPRDGPRVRVTSSTGPRQRRPTVSYASDRAEVLLAVARWWDDVMAAAPAPGRPPG